MPCALARDEAVALLPRCSVAWRETTNAFADHVGDRGSSSLMNELLVESKSSQVAKVAGPNVGYVPLLARYPFE